MAEGSQLNSVNDRWLLTANSQVFVLFSDCLIWKELSTNLIPRFLSAEWRRSGGASGGTDFPALPDRG